MPGVAAGDGAGSRRSSRRPAAVAAATADAAGRVAHVGLVAAITFVAYANALGGAFLWDDRFLVVDDPAIKRWDALPRLFVSDLFPAGVASGYYRPLQALSYALDYRLWGLAPLGFHLTNVVLHAAAAALLYLVAARVLASASAALVAAALFAVHPLHVEAVTYVAGRSDPLAAVFELLAMLGFLRGGRRDGVLALVAFAAALLAREAALVLPVLFFVVDRVPPGRPRRPVTAYLPYAVVGGLYLALRTEVVGASTASAATSVVPLGLRLLTMAEVVVGYLGLVLVPHGLHMERAVAPVASPLDPTALAAVAGVVALAVVAWRLRHRAWPVTLGVAWFFAALLPVANVVPLATFMAEHWLYVPLMGLALAVGWSVVALPPVAWRRAIQVVAALAVTALGTLTVRRNFDWRDGRTLYESLLPLAPGSVRVNLAEAYQEAGEAERARAVYEDLVRARPDERDTADALNNLGNIDRTAGRLDAALTEFERALALEPEHVAALNGRALVLQRLGRIDEAERQLLAALAIAPDSATTHSNLGNLYFRRDEVARARDEYLAAVRLDPEHADAHNNLGSAYYRLGDRARAEAEFRTALRIHPGSEDARRNLAVATGTATTAPPTR